MPNVLLVLELQRLLKEHYQEECSNIQYVPTNDSKTCAFRDIYVLPKLVKKDHRRIEDEGDMVKRVNVKKYGEIFKDNNKERMYRNVFVVGEAGSGKSSFSQNIAYLWSEENKKDAADHQFQDFSDVDIIRDFDFLFHVTLRDACGHCDLVDIINDQLLCRLYTDKDKRKNAYSLVKEVLVEETCHCLIVADGMDEWSHPKECGEIKCTDKEKGIRPLIHQRNRATVLLTSRPVGFKKIPEHKVDNYLEIEGAKDVQQLGSNILKVLNGNTGTRRFDEFQTIVKENKMWDMLSQSPILLIQQLCLWFDKQALSKSVSITFARLFDMLIKRGNEGTSKNENLDINCPSLLSNMKNINTHWQNFAELCKFAFEKLFASDGYSAVTFSSDDCNEDLKQFAVKCGILTEKKSKSVSENSHHLSFHHKTFQEFLACVHLSLHDDLLATDIEPRYSSYYKAHAALEKIFVFMCALNGNTAVKMSVFLNELDKGDPNLLISKGFREALYAGNTDIQLVCPRRITIDEPCNTDIDCYSKWIKKNTERIDMIKLRRCEQLLHQDCKFLMNIHNLVYISLNETQLGDLRLQLPSNIIKLELNRVTMARGDVLHDIPHLQNVVLNYINLGELQLHLPSSVTAIHLWNVTTQRGDFIHDLPQLQEVRLYNMKIDDLKLSLPKSVTTLSLNMVSLTRGDFLNDLPLLKHVRCESMSLGNIQLHLPSSVTTFWLDKTTLMRKDFLNDLPELQEVTLWNMHLYDPNLELPSSDPDISPQEVSLRGDVLQHLHPVKTIKLWNIQIDGFQLPLLSNVTTIVLSRVTMTRGDCLCNLPQLNNVRIGYTNLGDLQFRLPSSVTHIHLNQVTSTRGDYLQGLPQLEEVSVWNMSVSDPQLLIPSSVETITLSGVILTRGDFLKDLSQLKKVNLWNTNIDNFKLLLPSSVASITLSGVTQTREDFLHELPLLQEIHLEDMNLSDLRFHLPSSTTTVTLSRVTMTKGDMLVGITCLQNVTLQNMNIGELQLPANVRKVHIENVSMSVDALLRVIECLKRTSHDVECTVMGCIVQPADQTELIETHLRESTSLQLEDFEGDSTMSFRLHRRIEQNVSRTNGLKIC